MEPGMSIKFAQVELVARTLVITKEDIKLGGRWIVVSWW